MSGRRRDPLAAVLRAALRLASVPYSVAVAARNRRYESGKAEVHRCGARVISVGNLTTGGTGKTPIVCFLASWFRQHGIRVAIVSRGYGRGDADANDEAMELHARLPDVPHVQDPDRVEAARIAVEELESQLILMDDGFQHRRLHRDLNIVVIDATCPFGFGYVLPRGLLREPVRNLRRADIVILSRCDAVDDAALSGIESTVRRYADSIPIIHSIHAPSGLLEFPDRSFSIDTLRSQRVAVVSAIGNPDAFESTVRDCGAEVIASQRLPDHDEYSPNTVLSLRTWAESLDQVDRVVCTHKDLVKLQTDRMGGRPLAAVTIELQITSPTESLEQMLMQIADSISTA